MIKKEEDYFEVSQTLNSNYKKKYFYDYDENTDEENFS
jgi:hypothetical protein